MPAYLLPVFVALTALSCRQPPAPPPPPPAADAGVDLAPPQARAVVTPWRVPGVLLGTTDVSAIVLSDEIVSVEISTGASVSAATTAEAPRPSFDRLLPRHGAAEKATVPVDRLRDAPIFVGAEVVVFLRGTDEATTGLVGLDAATMQEDWVFPLNERLPLGSCANEFGVLIVPEAGEPARVVDWSGQQKWLRELAGAEESIDAVSCGATDIEVQLRKGKKLRTVVYDGDTGDLREVGAEVGPTGVPRDGRVRQLDGAVERVLGHELRDGER